MSDKKYKLTALGIALQESANDKKNPAKGIIYTQQGPVDIKSLQDGDPELAKLSDTDYVK